jgi:poly(A) polymerase
MFPATPQFAAAFQIIAALRADGHEAYLAGGCVRDLLLGTEPHDFDVATSATPDVVLNLFPRTFAVGAHFGVVLVVTCGEADAAGAAIQEMNISAQVVTEVATFRSDGAYSDGRHPDAVRYTLSAEEDVQRRDFTINGLLLDPERLFPQGLKPGYLAEFSARLKSCPDTKPDSNRVFPQPSKLGLLAEMEVRAEAGALQAAVIDHVGGLADLKAGIIRAIGQPAERFEEDHLRMLRAVRFAARFGFEIDPATAAAIRRLAPKTKAVSRERVRDELTKMLTEGRARRAFELLDETGLLAETLPEIARMKGVEQPPQFHPEGDVWTHTLGLLGQLDAGCSATLAWGALLHDVGKPATFRRAERIRFDGHVEVGIAIAAAICRRFRFSNDESRQTLALVENHMRFADAPRMKASTLKRFFRLENFPEHLALHRMDCLAGSGNLDHWNFVRDHHAAMPEEAVRPKPLITGRELIAAGYRPGAAFKVMLRTVEDAQLEGTIATEEEALKLIQERFPLD